MLFLARISGREIASGGAMPRWSAVAGVAVAVGTMLAPADAAAQRGGGGGRMGGPSMERQAIERPEAQPREFFEAKGLFSTGLTPVFPPGSDCPAVSSPFGAPTRYDGSARNNEFFGLHNGVDITLPPGTPLLAMADGEVVHRGTGGMLVGNFIWMRFEPRALGHSAYVQPAYAFVRYQHLDEPSPLAVGDRFAQGQAVGRSGNTGTAGGHYGAVGYAHLHFNVLVSDSPDFTVRDAMVAPINFRYLDPIGLFVAEPVAAFNNAALRDLPADKKVVQVGVAGDGGSRMIWPVACATR